MDRALILHQMGIPAEHWGPCYQDVFTHKDFAAKWRGAKPCPSEAEMASASVTAEQMATSEAHNQVIKAQIAALDLKRVRPLAEGDTVYLAKLNEQIKALRAQLK